MLIKAIFNAIIKLVQGILKIIGMILEPFYKLVKAIGEGLYYGIGGMFGIKREYN